MELWYNEWYMDTERKGFWSWLTRAYDEPVINEATPEVREGSISSAGGDSPLPGIVPPARSDVAPLSVEAALSMSAVYRAVDTLCNAVMQLELRVERGEQVIRPPALVAKPDVNSNLSKFLKKTTMSLAAHGNAYWRVYRSDESSPVTNLEVLNPLTVSIQYDDQGKRFYVAGDRTLKDWQVKHLKLMEPFGSDYGLGPIQAARVSLQGHKNMANYAGRVFGEYPSGIVSSKDYLDPAMQQAYKDAWYRDEATGQRIKFLGNGLAYQPIILDPVDAQFIENQKWNKTEVATVFGVPANYLLADAGNSLTYQNMIQVDTAFVRYTLTGYLREIEEAFTDLLPRGQKARFNVEGFLRADDKTRSEVNKTYKEMGVRSAEEIRIAEGWGPMPEALNNQPAPAQPESNEGTANV